MALKDSKVVSALLLLALCLAAVWYTMAEDSTDVQALPFPRKQVFMEGSPSDTTDATDDDTLKIPSAPQLRTHRELRCETVWDVPPTNVDLWNISVGRYAEQGCARRPNIRCSGQKLKALVVYMLHTRDLAHDMQPEMWNLNYFTRFGIYGAAQPTEMFERVDYVFTRMMPAGMKEEGHGIHHTQLCAEDRNVKLLWVPDGPCDLCAHHRVLEYLGGVQRVKKKYAYLVYLNAGTRGPFQALDDPAWIDVLAMSGYDVWDAKDKGPAVMTGATVSPEHSIHAQSNFIGVHTSALEIVDAFLNRCSGDKMNCIFEGEVPAGAAFLKAGGWVHALSRNETVRTVTPGMEDYAALQRRHHPSMPNPMLTPIDVCAAMFMKHGGVYLRGIPEMVAAHASQLTLHQSPHRALAGEATFKALIASCPFVRM